MAAYAKKGDYVQIHEIVLKPEQRSPHLPEDTKNTPLELWVKGFLNNDANIGGRVEIVTVTGRHAFGELVEINPGFDHDFGEFIPELIHIGPQLREMLDMNYIPLQNVALEENGEGGI